MILRRASLLLLACSCLADQPSQLQQELTALEAQNATRRLDLQTAQQARLKTRTAIAKQILAYERKIHQQEEAYKRIAEQQARQLSRKQALDRASAEINAELPRMRAQLELLAREVPGRKDIPMENIAELAQGLSEVHAAATQTRVSSVTVHWGDAPRTVDLLSVGFAQFAASERPDSNAVVIAAPADASGYRWQPELPAVTQQQITSGLADIEANRIGMIPFDLTGSMRIETWDATANWRERIRAGGPLMVPLLGVALVALLCLLERILVFWRERSAPKRINQALQACEQRNAEQALSIVQGTKGLAARLIRVALEKRPAGQAAMEEMIEVQLLQEVPRLRRRLGGIAVLAAIAPLLGLLGTVTGIIQTFAVIQTTGGTDIGLMAGGIAQALITTATGLIIAIPVLIGHRILLGSMDRLVSAAESKAAIALTLLSSPERQS